MCNVFDARTKVDEKVKCILFAGVKMSRDPFSTRLLFQRGTLFKEASVVNLNRFIAIF